MFRTKYKVTLLDSKWIPIKIGVKFFVIPRKDEFIYIDKYYRVLNVVHNISDKHDILVVVEEFSQPKPTENEVIKK